MIMVMEFPPTPQETSKWWEKPYEDWMVLQVPSAGVVLTAEEEEDLTSSCLSTTPVESNNK